MKYYYHINPNAFYSDEYPGVIESAGLTLDDLVEISEEDYNALFNPPEGKYMVFDDNGPRLETLPSPDYVAIAESTRESLLNDMQSATYTMSAKLALGRTLTDSEKDSFNAWLDYSDALQALDMSTAPDIEWPEKPA